MTTPSDQGHDSYLPLLIVFVLVAGMMAAIAVPNVYAAVQRSKQKRTMSDMRSLATALGEFQAEHGGFPADSRGLEAAWARLAPRYITDPPARDGWRRRYRYEAPATPGSDLAPWFRISSAGRDGIFQGPTNNFARYFDCDIIYEGS